MRTSGALGTKWAEVDVDAVRDNTRSLSTVAGVAAVMAMVKANGYGHGAVLAARAALAGGAAWLGVSSVAEALELRAAGIDAPILNVGWTPPEQMEEAIRHQVDITVFDAASVRAAAVAARRLGHPGRVHWKLDTGMGRLGTRPAEVAGVRQALREEAVELSVAGIFTHFACADEADLSFTEQQHQRFTDVADALRDDFPGALLHAANSAALLRLPQTHHDLVRLGIAIYGYQPAPTVLPLPVPLRPALRVVATVTCVKEVGSGDSVGYGREWVADRPTLVATVAAGYADGVDRRRSAGGQVICGGALCPIIGRVSMDQMGVDVSGAGRVRPGDPAVVLGSAAGLSMSAADIATQLGTIPNEVLCAVSARVPRVPVNGAAMDGR